MARELVIYCDESVRDGPYFSNFYGGLLIESGMLEPVAARLRARRDALGLRHEIKWEGVTPSVEQRYIHMMSSLFAELHAGHIKIRVMFTQNRDRAHVTAAQRAARYHLLYYQFIKHAFGLEWAGSGEAEVRVRLLLDRMPATAEQSAQFRGFVAALSLQPRFRRSGIRFFADQIAEINSADHILAQSLDVVLGAMAFRLNDWHKAKPAGAHRRGRRTIAKERVYNHIRSLVCSMYPRFNIGVSTATRSGSDDQWSHPYRHWCFVPKMSTRDDSLTKRGKKETP